jgi:hypothetical protein
MRNTILAYVCVAVLASRGMMSKRRRPTALLRGRAIDLRNWRSGGSKPRARARVRNGPRLHTGIGSQRTPAIRRP